MSIVKIKIDYDNKRFRPVSNSDNGEVSNDMIFHYKQTGNIITCTYREQNILAGHLIGIIDENSCIQMSYHQVNKDGELMTGICTSRPEKMDNGKIRLHESWQWTSGDRSKGHSVLEEI